MRPRHRAPPAARDQSRCREVSSVLVEASVQDELDAPFPDLTIADFALRENDMEQTLDLVRSDTSPIDLHTSGRLQPEHGAPDGIRPAGRRAARSATSAPTIRSSSRRSPRRSAPSPDPTTDRETVTTAIRVTRSGGGTAVLDTVTRLPELLNGATGRQAVILLTDGYDEHSTPHARGCGSRGQSRASHAVRRRHRRRGRNLDQGRTGAARPGGTIGRPGVLSHPRRRAAQNPRADRRRHPAAVPARVYPEQPDGRRPLAPDRPHHR